MHPHSTLRTLLTLPLLIALASPVLALSEAEVPANFNGMTRAGTIDSALKDGVIGGFPEKKYSASNLSTAPLDFWAS